MPDSANETPRGAALKDALIKTLRTVCDPEIPVNIYDLGLIYDLDVSDGGAVHIRMTLTSPACPVAGSLPPQVEAGIRAVDGVTEAKVELVWDPPWEPTMMSDAARLQLNLDLDGSPPRYPGPKVFNINALR